MEEITKDSFVLKNYPQASELFKVYRYTVEFNSATNILRGKIRFFFNEEYRLIDQPIFQFDSMYKLSLREINEILKGTTGILKIKGEFKREEDIIIDSEYWKEINDKFKI